MEKFALYTIVGTMVTAALIYLNKVASRHTTKNKEGWYTLRMNRLYQIVGILVGIIGLSFLFLGLSEQDTNALITVLILSLGFIALGFICFLWFLNHRLNFNEKTIIASSFNGKPTSLNWQEITNISFSSFSGLITLTGSNGEIVKAHQHLAGLNSFIELMERQTKWTAKSLNLPINRKKTTT
jgi:hypothetical protein